MNTRWLLNLILLVAVVAIGVFIATREEDDKLIRLGGVEPASVTQIRISREGLDDVRLERETSGKWVMTYPYNMPANQVAANKLLELPAAISHTRFPVGSRNLKDYGLQPAKATLKLNTTSYAFGNIEHINKRRYVLLGDTVHLATDLFFHQLRVATEHFASNRLLEDDMQIAALELPGLTLEQSATGDWITSGTQSEGKEISGDAIQALLDHWRHGQATQLTPASDIESGEQARITLSDNTLVTYDIIRSGDELLLVRADRKLQYHLPLSVADKLLTLN